MHLTLHLTKSCNMCCTYCYAPPKPCTGMSEEVAFKALEMGSQLNETSAGIVFFGGEPLLHKTLIMRTVKRARAMELERAGRFHFKMTTNGLLLDDAFLDFALEENILIALSFDGVKEAHDAHRRLQDGSGTWDIVYEKLRLLLAARPYTSILMVVNPDTAQYLCDSVSLLIEEGCRYILVSLNYAAPWDEKTFKVLAKQYKKLAKLYIKWTREERKFYLSPFEVKLSSHINRHCYRKERCELAERQLSVDPEGYLFPCVQFVKAGSDSEWCIGDIFSGIDEEARQGIHEVSQEEKEFCRDCAIKERCNHTCGCLNWQTTQSINSISPVLCRHEQMVTPLADKIGNTLYKERNALFIQKHYNEAYPILSLLEDTLEEDA